MKPMTELVTKTTATDHNALKENNALWAGGLPVRTDLRAGLAWDDLDDKAQELWSSLTSALSSLVGGSDTGS